MLSGDPSEAAAAAADQLSSSWLPEFDSPGISLDMTSLSVHGDDVSAPKKPDDCASAKSRSSELPAEPQSQASTASPQPPTAPSPKKQKQCQSDADIPLSAAVHDSVADPAAGTSTSTSDDASVAEPTASVVDHYGLTFTFTTDPEIDAIATSPLFSIATPSASSSPEVDQPQPEDVATQQQQQQQQPDTSGGRRLKSRRASIASMLMRRSVVSKPVDATSIASKSTTSPRLNTHVVSSNDALEPLHDAIELSTNDDFSAAVAAAATAAAGTDTAAAGTAAADTAAADTAAADTADTATVDRTDSVKLPLDEPASEEISTEAPEVAEGCDQLHTATASVSSEGDGDCDGDCDGDSGDTDDGGDIDSASSAGSNDSSIKQPEVNPPPEPQPAKAQDDDAPSNEQETEPTCARECVGVEPLADDT
ncbi:hypothetical protein LPJ59_003426, partial [Coemansia sp. RSA 2399]